MVFPKKKATRKDPPLLTFLFSQLVGAYIFRLFAIAVPVPAGEEETAVRGVRALDSREI